MIKDSVEPYEILLCVVLTALSAFLSGSEIALFTLSKAQLKTIREKFRSIHKVIRQILADPSGLLMTILITNELVNIALSTLVTSGLSGYAEQGWILSVKDSLSDALPEWAIDALIGTLVTAPIVLILGDVTPKIFSARLNMIVAPIVARPMNFIYQMLAPLRWSIRSFLRVFSLLIPKRTLSARALSAKKFKQEDFLNMVEEAHKEGDVQQTELELIRGIFDMDETAVDEILTPMHRVFALPQTMTIEKALGAIRDDRHQHKFSRIPVYGENLADVIGILYSKDLLIAKLEKIDHQTPISTLVWKPLNVHHTTRLSSVFKKMKRQRTHMAIVMDDAGDPLGIVTMNDVLESMLEELIEGDEVEVAR